ncbi:MAG: hypothetical protein H7289_10880, partial [Mucilaginibacter sp.]|nr:hypothetical protein [Mucilaginibacter sp.]
MLFAAVWLCLIFTNGIVNAQVNQVVNDGSNTAPVIFPPTDCVYKWLNDNTSIGLAAKGTGNIASFTTINKGYAPAVANITARVVSYAYQTIGTTTYAIDLIDYSQAGVISVPSASLQGTSPDGSVVYFAKGTDNRTLYKVDGKNNTLLATIPVRDGFYNGSLINGVKGLLFSLDGSKIYTYSAQAKAVIVINTVTNAVERLINLNPAITTYNGLMLMSPDATLIYIMGGSLSTPNQSVLNIVSTVTNTIVSTVNLGQGQGRMFLTTDGTKLFINSTAAGPSSVLTQYDTATGDISNVPIPNGMSFSTISPDGKKIYLTQDTKVEYGYPIHILDVKTGNVTPANLGFTYVVAGYGFSPNGEVIHFRELATGTIKVVSTKTDVVIATIKQSPVVGINVIDQQTLTNYDGSKMYVTTYAGVNNTEKRKYLQVIDYKTYTVTDSIPLPVDGGPIVPTKAPYPCAGSAINFSITVNPPPLVIAVTGTLTNVDAVYGTPGITTSFTLSGTNLPTGVIVTPPAG